MALEDGVQALIDQASLEMAQSRFAKAAQDAGYPAVEVTDTPTFTAVLRDIATRTVADADANADVKRADAVSNAADCGAGAKVLLLEGTVRRLVRQRHVPYSGDHAYLGDFTTAFYADAFRETLLVSPRAESRRGGVRYPPLTFDGARVGWLHERVGVLVAFPLSGADHHRRTPRG